MKTYANKGLATKAAKRAGIIGARLLQDNEGKWFYENPQQDATNVQDADVPPVADAQQDAQADAQADASAPEQESPVADAAPATDAENAVPADPLADMTDDEFARAMLAGAGRQSRKSAPAEKKSAKTHPGMYAGERRGYPKREGLCKSYWDFMTQEWENAQKSEDFVLTAQEIRDICDAYGWTPSSFAAEYRYWRLHFGLPVRARGTRTPHVQASDNAPAPVADAAPASVRKGRGKKKQQVELDEVTQQSDVKITEV